MIGCSDVTREKWERLEYLLRIHAPMYRAIMQRERWLASAYAYFDFFAGPGLYGETDSEDLAGEYGSPIRALRVLHEFFGASHGLAANGEPLGIRFHFYDPLEAPRLAYFLHQSNVRGGIVEGVTCEDAIDSLVDRYRWLELTGCSPGKTPGLAFFDPNGMASWDAIGRFASAKHFALVDLLINVNSTVGKRVRRSPLHAETRTPTEYLAGFGKKHVYLWEPTPNDRHQFALAFCTNYGGFPKLKRFHPIDTDKGRRIADRIDLTHDERRERGGHSGFLPGLEGFR